MNRRGSRSAPTRPACHADPILPAAARHRSDRRRRGVGRRRRDKRNLPVAIAHRRRPRRRLPRRAHDVRRAPRRAAVRHGAAHRRRRSSTSARSPRRGTDPPSPPGCRRAIAAATRRLLGRRARRPRSCVAFAFLAGVARLHRAVVDRVRADAEHGDHHARRRLDRRARLVRRLLLDYSNVSTALRRRHAVGDRHARAARDRRGRQRRRRLLRRLGVRSDSTAGVDQPDQVGRGVARRHDPDACS